MPKDRLVSLRELKSAAEPDIPVDGDEVDNVEAVEAQRKIEHFIFDEFKQMLMLNDSASI